MLRELPKAIGESTVAFVRDNEGGIVLDGGPGGFAGSVAADAGIRALVAPVGVGELEADFGYVELSGERLDVLAGAELIVTPEPDLEALMANPLWAGLPAGQSGRVLTLANLIYNGGNHYAAELLAHFVAEALR